MSTSHFSDQVIRSIDDLIERGTNLFDGTVRLGVTGLSRAGKTVFITALVHNLLRPGRLPLLDVVAGGRFEAAIIRPQPDADVPRFEYEEHIAALQAPIPHWPESTRKISQLRVAVRFQPKGFWRRQLAGSATLNIDIVDYPGEWLLDLPLLRQGFADWSARTLEMCQTDPRRHLSAQWRAYIGGLDAAGPDDEAVARHAAGLFSRFLHAARADGMLLSRLQPGRFLMPGELEGSPALTFSPLILPPEETRPPRGSLWALMERRFEAYKDVVVRPFFRNHFARLDRQIVLVDALGCLNAGPASVADLRAALTDVTECFRPGPSNWLWPILGRRIDRVLFAAPKADHVPAAQHGRLTDFLGALMFDPINRAAFKGARVETMALAALRATREAIYLPIKDREGNPFMNRAVGGGLDAA